MARQERNNIEEIVVDTPADIREITANKSDMPLTAKSDDSSTTNISVNFTLTNLFPNTEYVITVEANTSAGYGNRSQELHIQTDPGVCVSERESAYMCACMVHGAWCVCVCVCV